MTQCLAGWHQVPVETKIVACTFHTMHMYTTKESSKQLNLGEGRTEANIVGQKTGFYNVPHLRTFHPRLYPRG